MKGTLNKKKIPSKDIFFFRQRFKNKIFQSVLSHFADLAKEKNLAKKDIANLLDKDPSQITRWFAGPNNWTLDTISDLLLAMDAELKHEISPLHENKQQTTNIEENLTGEPTVYIPWIAALQVDHSLPSGAVRAALQIRKHFESLQHDSSLLKFLEGSGQENRVRHAGLTSDLSGQAKGNRSTLRDTGLIH